MKQTVLLLFLLAQAIIGFSQCNAPTNLTATYANNVTNFSWDAVSGATKYRLQFKYSANSWAFIEYEDSTTTNSFSLTGIMLSTTFDWRVQTDCGTSVSGYTQAPTSFTVPCPQPTSLNAANITTNSAILNWTHDPATLPDYGAVYLAYRPANTNSSWIQRGTILAGTFSLTGLQPGTTYEWCVNQVCPYFSSPPVVHTFTTVYPPCGIASLWLPGNVTTTQATLRWIAVPNAANYVAEYKEASATTWTVLAPTTSLSATITGLTASTGYQWRVKTECLNNVNTGAYSGIASFTTASPPPPPPVACGTPANVTISNLGNRAATATWTAVPNATAYQFWQKVANGTTSWVGYTVNNATTFTRTTYLMNTTYLYRVRAICGNVNGAYTPDGTFTTLNCVSAGDNSYEWLDLFSLGSISRTSGAEPGGYANTGQSTNLTIGANNVAGQISAGTSGSFRNQNYAIFIDFNRNGSYEDSGERVANGNVNNAGTINFSLNVPSTATVGVTGLRVIMAKQGGPMIAGCQSGFQGETEDYTVNLVAPSARISAETAEPLADVSVFPNPASDAVQVRIPDHIRARRYELLNGAGIRAAQADVNGETEVSIDLRGQPSGLFFLNVIDEQGQRYVKKVLKL